MNLDLHLSPCVFLGASCRIRDIGVKRDPFVHPYNSFEKFALVKRQSVIDKVSGKTKHISRTGGQFELSGAPLETLHQTCIDINSHLYQADVKDIVTRFLKSVINVTTQLSYCRFDPPAIMEDDSPLPYDHLESPEYKRLMTRYYNANCKSSDQEKLKKMVTVGDHSSKEREGDDEPESHMGFKETRGRDIWYLP
ncbi:glutamate--cysteine ligase, chloroplastic [Tanacetum coccineum]